MSDLEGKVVLITGTARGCGQVLAEAFAGAGAKVVACDRDAEAGAQVAEQIRAASGEIDPVAAGRRGRWARRISDRLSGRPPAPSSPRSGADRTSPGRPAPRR